MMMSLAGTIPLVIYYLIKLIFKEQCSTRLKMRLLKLSMFFYLCPFQECKYRGWFPYIKWLYPERTGEKIYLKRPGYMAVGVGGGYYRLLPLWEIGLLAIWMVVIVALVGWQLWKYVRLKRALKKTSYSICEDSMKDYGRKTVCYMRNPLLKAPFTIGVWRPWIIFPEAELDSTEKEIIALHEMTHIKNHDILQKMVCLVVILLHWFNPAAWVLLYEYGVVSEQICDEVVTSKLNTLEERKIYAALLVEMAVKETKIPIVFADHLSGGKKRLKKRVDAILEPKKKKAGMLSAVIVLAVTLCSATIAAYEKPFATTRDNIDETAEEMYVVLGTLSKSYDFSTSDIIFTEEQTGESFSLSLQEDVSAYAQCIHNYVTGIIAKHTKNSSGGCTVDEYQAKYCTKCGKRIIIKQISTHTYYECPH